MYGHLGKMEWRINMDNEELYRKALKLIEEQINGIKYGDESNVCHMILGIIKTVKMLRFCDDLERVKTNEELIEESREKIREAIDEYNTLNNEDIVCECITEKGNLIYVKTALD